jgi:hypothetical protein
MLLSNQIALYWDCDNAYAEIDFDGSGYVDAYGKRDGIDEVFLDRCPAGAIGVCLLARSYGW